MWLNLFLALFSDKSELTKMIKVKLSDQSAEPGAVFPRCRLSAQQPLERDCLPPLILYTAELYNVLFSLVPSLSSVKNLINSTEDKKMFVPVCLSHAKEHVMTPDGVSY